MYDGLARFTRRLLYAWVYAVNRGPKGVGVVLSCGVLAPPMPPGDSCQDSGFPARNKGVVIGGLNGGKKPFPPFKLLVRLFQHWRTQSTFSLGGLWILQCWNNCTSGRDRGGLLGLEHFADYARFLFRRPRSFFNKYYLISLNISQNLRNI